MLRAVLAAPIIVLDTLLFGLAGILVAVFDRSGRAAQAMSRAWSLVLLRACGIRVTVAGMDLIPAGPAVYAANHGSALDIPIVFAHLPVAFRIIYKRSLSHIPLVGWYLFLAGHIAIDRGNPFKARKSLAAAAARIRSGTSVVVFPEGTRSSDESVRSFKRGSFVLALDAGVPVVPVSIVGIKRIAPRGFFSLHPGAVEVRIHTAIETAGRPTQQAEALADEVRTVVIAGCDRSACERR